MMSGDDDDGEVDREFMSVKHHETTEEREEREERREELRRERKVSISAAKKTSFLAHLLSGVEFSIFSFAKAV